MTARTSRCSARSCARAATPVARCALTGLLALVAVGTLRAQESSTPTTETSALPFRAGQWGAEFSYGSFSSLGALRFRSPNRAWVGTVGGEYERTAHEDDAAHRTLSRVDLTMGHRWYRALHDDVAQFVTVGAVLGWRRTETSLPFNPLSPPGQSPSPLAFESNMLVGGLTANVGAQWMVTSSLSLGATWSARAVLGRDRDRARAGPEAEGALTRTSVNAFVGRLGVLGTLYF